MAAVLVAALLVLTAPAGATADQPAERGPTVQLDPLRPPPEPVFTDNCAEMSYYRAAVGLPPVFDRIGWRESNCRNEEGVHTSCCWGWYQLHVSLHLSDPRLAARYHDCGVWSRFDVDSDTPGDKQRQACAAKAVYDTVGMSAWSTR